MPRCDLRPASGRGAALGLVNWAHGLARARRVMIMGESRLAHGAWPPGQASARAFASSLAPATCASTAATAAPVGAPRGLVSSSSLVALGASARYRGFSRSQQS